MKVLVTGTAGRLGRAIYVCLMNEHSVIGLDRQPCSTVDYTCDLRDEGLVRPLLEKVDIVVHTAALHAPHVGLVSEGEFESINVSATRSLMQGAIECHIKHFVFTSTTALYGHASKPAGRTCWVDEHVEPKPRTIYHRTKLEAEHLLEELSLESGIPVTVLRVSRCFPEPADQMALYRLNRGIDARDVATAHCQAIGRGYVGFRRFIVSGKTPFRREQCHELYTNAAEVIEREVPAFAQEFSRRGWLLPASVDRVYDSSAAQKELSWMPQYDYKSVLEILDSGMSEVLPVTRYS